MKLEIVRTFSRIFSSFTVELSVLADEDLDEMLSLSHSLSLLRIAMFMNAKESIGQLTSWCDVIQRMGKKEKSTQTDGL